MLQPIVFRLTRHKKSLKGSRKYFFLQQNTMIAYKILNNKPLMNHWRLVLKAPATGKILRLKLHVTEEGLDDPHIDPRRIAILDKSERTVFFENTEWKWGGSSGTKPRFMIHIWKAH